MSPSYLRSETAASPYAAEIETVLPRILALADRDGLSPSRGIVDRQFWAWKLIDFPNGSFQGAVNGLSTLLAADALTEHLHKGSIEERIREMFAATGRITRSDGSLEEAFPHERSYCVTAAVAFDLLKCLDAEAVRTSLESRVVERVIGPLIGFLVRADETHGMISNHLATAAAALLRWHARTGDTVAKDKAQQLIDRILANQSAEGWFSEYGGADPGYQTLCLTHFADVLEQRPGDDRLFDALARSVKFLTHFVHPDGSFGGIYGSRATRIYYPGGIEALAKVIPEAAAIARRMRQSIADHTTVPLRAIDQPNLIPMFNSYCAALIALGRREPDEDIRAQTPLTQVRHHFPEAGLIVDSGPRHYTVISSRKGGVVYHWKDDRLALCDAGIALKDSGGALVSSQTDDRANGVDLQPDAVSIGGQLRRLEHPLPGPLRFAALRILAATAMRLSTVNSFVKKLLVRYLVSARRTSYGGFRRTIQFGPDLHVRDEWERGDLDRLETPPFSAIHMASQGYWQIQDDAKNRNGVAR